LNYHEEQANPSAYLHPNIEEGNVDPEKGSKNSKNQYSFGTPTCIMNN